MVLFLEFLLHLSNLDVYPCVLLLVKDKQIAKSMVVGRPILLALEEIDGTPSFLEKALRFVEEHGEVHSHKSSVFCLFSHVLKLIL